MFQKQANHSLFIKSSPNRGIAASGARRWNNRLQFAISSGFGWTNKAKQKFLTSKSNKAKLQYRAGHHKFPHLQQYLFDIYEFTKYISA